MTDPWIEEGVGAGAATSGPEPGPADEPVGPEAASAADAAAWAGADAAGERTAGPGTERDDGPPPLAHAPDPTSASAPPSTAEDPSPAPDAPADALPAAVRRLEAHVSAETARVLQAFGDKLAFDGFKEEQVARLHAELQQHREGMLERAIRPLLNAVIRVHDDVGKVVASLRARPAEEITPERTFRTLDGFREDLELLLSQHGVEPFEPLDDVFDPRLHTALRTVHTGQPERAGRIAERLRPGFSHGEALLQKARVAVFTAQGGPPSAPPSAASTRTPTAGEEG